MNIGENIRRIRKEKGWTMKKLGEEIGISEQGIGNYERGDREPNIETIKKISEALDVPIQEIIGEDLSDVESDFIDSEVNILIKEREFNHDTALSFAISKLVRKPSEIEKEIDLRKKTDALYAAVKNLIDNEAMQKEYDYNANDLPCMAIGDLNGFIHEMFKLKITEIKYNLEKGNILSDEEVFANLFTKPDNEK